MRVLQIPVLLIATSSLFARTYYVANEGNDSNTGTSSSRPWKTMVQVNKSRFVPGDQILFKRGNVWNETLKPPSSGTPSKQITFSAYGVGPLPVFDGQNTRQHVIIISNAGYITVQNLQLQNVTFTSHGETMLHILRSPHVTVSHCVFKNNVSSTGVYLDNDSPFLLVDSNVAVHDAGKTAGRFFTSAVTSTSDHPIVSNNTVPDPDGMVQHQIGTFDVNYVNLHGNNIAGGGIALQIHSCNRVVIGGTIHDNYIVGSNKPEGDGELIELTGRNDGGARGQLCAAGNGRGTTFPVTAAIYRNFVLFGRATKNGISGFYAINSDIYNNLIINNAGSSESDGFSWTTNSNNNHFYNNSLYYTRGAGFQFASSPCCNSYMNNIVKGTANFYATACPACIIDDYNLTTMNTLDGNGVRPGAHTMLNTDPKFVNLNPTRPEDFRLSPMSPAIGSGISLGAPYELGFDQGDTGRAMPMGQVARRDRWDRGAVIYFSHFLCEKD